MKSLPKTIGILAFQGGVAEHAKIITELGHTAVEVRNVEELKKCCALIIPGGESTTIGFFLEQTGMDKEIVRRGTDGFPVFGTCAGAIVLAKTVTGNIIPPHLGLLDITIRRNAYGRQVDSFYTDIRIPRLGIDDLHGAFIRAPIIEKAGAEVEILAHHEHEIVLVRQKNILVSTFHPELRMDGRLHEYFISLV